MQLNTHTHKPIKKMGVTGLRGNRTSIPGGHKQNLACTKTQRKEAVTLQDTEEKELASIGGSPVESWVGRGSPLGWRHWQQ